MTDEWADAMNRFREAVYEAMEAGCTAQELKDDVDEAERDR